MNIEIKNISKEIVPATGAAISLLKNISLTIRQGEITSIISPTGDKSSTLLKIFAQLESTSTGEIVNPSGKRIIYLPSEPSSFPWLNVLDNVVFGLDHYSKERILQFISSSGLEGYEKHIPHNNSLGFRFRISLARSLAHDPAAIVLDNPFVMMDISTREELYSLIKELQQKFDLTFVLGTSNISESLLLSDKIYLLSNDPGELTFLYENIAGEIHRRKSEIKNHLKIILDKIKPNSLSALSIC